MKPKDQIDLGQQDLFCSRHDQIIGTNHEYAVVAGCMDWVWLTEVCGRDYSDKLCHLALPMPLIAGLHLLKYTRDHSDGEVVAMWRLSRYYQYFCDEEFFRHSLYLDRSALKRWSQRMGEEKVTAILKESLNIAHRISAIKCSDIREVVIDMTLQPKNVARPADARLLYKAQESLVTKARVARIQLRQNYAFVGARAYRCCTCFNRGEPAGKALGSFRTYLCRVARDIGRKFDGNPVLTEAFREPLRIAERVRTQRSRDGVAEHVYAVHAPEVDCIGKGKRHRPWEFGVKALVTTLLGMTMGKQLILHVKALPGRTCDGHTLATILPDFVRLAGVPLWRIFVDRGCRGHNAAPEYEAKVNVTGQRRNTTPAIIKKMSRRNAVEPVVGDVKNEHRMGRNCLSGSEGNAMNPVLAAAGYNFHLLFWRAKVLMRLYPVRRILVGQFKLAKRPFGHQVSFSPSSQIP